jgi:hypothetical protein
MASTARPFVNGDLQYPRAAGECRNFARSAEIKRLAAAAPLVPSESPVPAAIWELSNGDIAVVGRDVTAAYEGRLPADITVAGDERVVVIPRNMLIAPKPDIPDA